MQETQEKAYSPKEMRTTLDIGDSTLRKWCIALEKFDYQFIRNEQGRRLFVESDVVVLRHFQNLIKQHNMQLDNAATLVIDRFGKGAFESSTHTVPAEIERDNERSNKQMNEILEKLENQEEAFQEQKEFNKELMRFNQELMQRLDDQQKYIEKKLEERDQSTMQRYTALLEARKEETQKHIEAETKRQVAAAEEENKKKSWLDRLLGR